MKSSFLEYYRANLEHLRELSAEFAEQYPKVASKLNISQLQVQDPFVERLLEGTAFLAARVEKKFDDGFPQFLQSLLLRQCPLLVSPIPAATVLYATNKINNDQSLSFSVSDRFDALTSVSKSPVSFSPLWNESILPGEVKNISYVISVANELPYADLSLAESKSALCVDLSFTSVMSAAVSDDLCFFLNMPDSDASMTIEALEQGLTAIYLKSGDECIRVDGIKPMLRILSEEKNIFERAVKTLPGLASLYLFFCYPFFFRFVRFPRLGTKIRFFNKTDLRMVMVFDRQLKFNRALRNDSWLLNAVAVINLFQKRSDRSSVSGAHESLCSLDRMRPLDYEVFSIDSVELYNRNNRQTANALPFYSSSSSIDNEAAAVFFSQKRKERLNGLYRKRSSYTKTEMYLAFSGDRFNADPSDFFEYTAVCWASNADLSAFVRSDAVFKQRGSEVSFKAVVPVTRPGMPLLMRGNKEGFAGLSYVMMNLSSLMYQDGERGKSVLRQMIGAFYPGDSDEKSLLQNAVAGFKSEKRVFRFVQRGSVFYEQGYKLKVILDEKELTGMGVYLFASVFRHLITNFCSINLLVELEVWGLHRGLIARWEQNL